LSGADDARAGDRDDGQVLSDLARRLLPPPAKLAERNGIPLLPMRERVVVTPDLVNALRDELP